MTLERLDTLDAVHPAWRERVGTLCLATGVYVQSAWRSRDLQARWRWCYLNGCPAGQGCHGVTGACPGANPPDLSFHETAQYVPASLRRQLAGSGMVVADEADGQLTVPCALAVDLGWTDDAAIASAHAVAGGLGLRFPLPAEPWHVQPYELGDSSTSPSRWWTPFGSLESFLVPNRGRYVPAIA